MRSHCSSCLNPQSPVVKVFDSLSVEQQLYSCGGLVLLSFLLLLIARFSFKYELRAWSSSLPRTLNLLTANTLFTFFLLGLNRLCPVNRRGSCRRSWSTSRRWWRPKRYHICVCFTAWDRDLCKHDHVKRLTWFSVWCFSVEKAVWRLSPSERQWSGHGPVRMKRIRFSFQHFHTVRKRFYDALHTLLAAVL